MANAVKHNKNKYGKNIKNLRLNNPGEIHTIDNEKKWLDNTRKYPGNIQIILSIIFQKHI